MRLLLTLMVLVAPLGAAADTDAQRELERTTEEFTALWWVHGNSEQGRQRLQLESSADPWVAEYLQRYPDPDLLRVQNARTLKLIYVEANRMVSFHRDESSTHVFVKHPVPAGTVKFLPQPERGVILTAPEGDGVKRSVTTTCFVVHPDGKILTTYHGLPDNAKLRVLFPDRSSYDATLEAQLPESDLALLSVPGLNMPYLPLAEAGSAHLGMRVFTVGFPAPRVLGWSPKFAEGAISSLRGHVRRVDLMLISIPIQRGNSGGPVVAESGEVVAVVVGSAPNSSFAEWTGNLPQNVNWATPAERGAALFAAPPPLAPAASRAEAIARVERATCMVDVGGR
jgi:S1-C subfamily serine protease